MTDRSGDRVHPEIRSVEGRLRFSAARVEDPLPHTSFGSAHAFARVEAVHQGQGKAVLWLPIESRALAPLDWTTIRVFSIDPKTRRFALIGPSGFDREGQAAWGEIDGPGFYGAYGLPANPAVREALDWLYEVHPLIVRERAFGRNTLLRTICDLILCANPNNIPPQGVCAMCLGLQIPDGGLPDFQLIPFRPKFGPLHDKTLPKPCRLVNGPIAGLDSPYNQIIKVDTPTAAAQVCVSPAANETVRGPAWSQDGKRLAYSIGDPIQLQSRLETRDAACGDVKVIVSGAGFFGWVAWNPSSSSAQRELAFTVDTGQGFRVDAVNEDGTNRRTLVIPSAVSLGGQQATTLYAPAYSPDGKFLAFIAVAGLSTSAVVVTKSDGTNPQQIFSPGGSPIYAPRWTPSGDGIACGVVTTTQSIEWHFYRMMNGVASGPPVIWSNPEIRFLSFSPDGLRVCGTRTLAGVQDELFVGDFDTTTFAVTNITGVQTKCYAPSWGPVCV